jgi:hypothetical protein
MKFISRHAELFEFYLFIRILFVYQVILSAWFLFSGDLNTNVDFTDFIFAKIYSKYDVRKQKLSLNHKEIKAI